MPVTAYDLDYHKVSAMRYNSFCVGLALGSSPIGSRQRVPYAISERIEERINHAEWRTTCVDDLHCLLTRRI